MFYYLEGSVAELEPNLVVLDCGGDAVSVRTECQIFKRYRHPAEK